MSRHGSGLMHVMDKYKQDWHNRQQYAWGRMTTIEYLCRYSNKRCGGYQVPDFQHSSFLLVLLVHRHIISKG